MDTVAVNRFRGWSGPLGRSIYRLAQETAFRQRATVGKESGALAASIRVGPRERSALGIQIGIGANASRMTGANSGYAMADDQGASPHVIRARNAPLLRFYWRRIGRQFEGLSVYHPGNRPYHWAMGGLRSAMRTWQRGG
jgi:hypothetical protein